MTMTLYLFPLKHLHIHYIHDKQWKYGKYGIFNLNLTKMFNFHRAFLLLYNSDPKDTLFHQNLLAHIYSHFRGRTGERDQKIINII